MEAEVTILVDSYNADFLKSLTHSALFGCKGDQFEDDNTYILYCKALIK